MLLPEKSLGSNKFLLIFAFINKVGLISEDFLICSDLLNNLFELITTLHALQRPNNKRR